MTRVLIIGALDGELGQAARIAQARGARLQQADGVAAGLARLRADGADLALCDLAHDVGWLVEQLAAERIACPVIACGRNADAAAAVRAIRAGAKEFLPLPPDAELIAAMLQAVAGEPDAPVHRDPAMAALLERAAQLARSEASVLITGESGTGKEVLARHIHRSSRRAGGPFVALNCAALPESLLESELFGHEKGAFSGAVAARKGKFEQAEGGTLLLDEIGEMDPRLQAKLLRAIQEREIDRLGGTQPVKLDVRILAATNRDLERESQRERFRRDLYFRLAVILLRLPPLRERGRDVLALAEHFLQRFRVKYGKPVERIDPRSQDLLLGYPWPGNVRELSHVIERAVLWSRGPTLQIEHLALEVPSEPPAGLDEKQPPSGPSRPTGMDLEGWERSLIEQALRETEGNQTRAAQRLGISRDTLRYRLKKYGLQA
jgi:two-component system response regulator FlrC